MIYTKDEIENMEQATEEHQEMLLEIEKIKAENEKLRSKVETFEIEKTALWRLIINKGYRLQWKKELEDICELSALHSLKELEKRNE